MAVLLLFFSFLYLAGQRADRALTKPGESAPGITAPVSGVGLASPGSVSEPAVRYRGMTAYQWAMKYKRRTQEYQRVRRALLTSPSVAEALNLAAAVYGFGSTLWALARCETGGTFNPRAKNPHSDASGLLQFMPSTFASTPYGHLSIWSPYANAMAGGWMLAHGRRGEWVC